MPVFFPTSTLVLKPSWPSHSKGLTEGRKRFTTCASMQWPSNWQSVCKGIKEISYFKWNKTKLLLCLNFKVHRTHFRIMRLIMLNAACRWRVCPFFQAEIKLASRKKLSWAYNGGLCGFPQNNACALPLNWYVAVYFFKHPRHAVSDMFQVESQHSRCLELYRFSHSFEIITGQRLKMCRSPPGVLFQPLGGPCWSDANINNTMPHRVHLWITTMVINSGVIKISI